MAVTYTVEGREKDVLVKFTELPDNPVFLRVERRVAGGVAPPPSLNAPTLVLNFSEGPSVWSAAFTWLNEPVVTVTLERRLNGGLWVPVSEDNEDGAYTDTGALGEAGNGRYEYRLNRNGRVSNTVRFTRGTEPPAVAASVEQTFTGQVKVTLVWLNTPQITVDVERSHNGGAWSTVDTGNSSGSYVDTVDNTGTYRYRLVLARLTGQPTTVDPSTARAVAPVLAQPTTSASSTILDGVRRTDVALSWQRQSGTTVTLQRSRNYMEWKDILTDTALTSYTDVVVNGRYEYRLIYNTFPLPSVTVTVGSTVAGFTGMVQEISSTSRRLRFTWTRTRSSGSIFIWVRGAVNDDNNRNGDWRRASTSVTRQPYTYFVNLGVGTFEVFAHYSDGTTTFDGERSQYGAPTELLSFKAGPQPPALSLSSSVSGGQRNVNLSWSNVPEITVRVQRNNNDGVWADVSIDNNTGIFLDTVPDTGVDGYRIIWDMNTRSPWGSTISDPVYTSVEVAPTAPIAPPTSPDPDPEPTQPTVPARPRTSIREFSREEVTGLRAAGEVFNLPRVRGVVRGADGDSDGRVWIVETRTIRSSDGDSEATVVLRYNPVSGQGWLFTAPDLVSPTDIATTDTELFLCAGATVRVYDKPTTVRDNAPGGVLQSKRDFTLASTIAGLSAYNDMLYANLGRVLATYSVTDGSRVSSLLAEPDTSTTVSVSALGVFAARRGSANPATFWFRVGSSWRVLQSGVEPRVSAIAATDTAVYIVDRDAGLVSPYTVVAPTLLTEYVDRSAPLATELEYRVGAQGYNKAFERGAWIR